jgi:hypothetical protein
MEEHAINLANDMLGSGQFSSQWRTGSSAEWDRPRVPQTRGGGMKIRGWRSRALICCRHLRFLPCCTSKHGMNDFFLRTAGASRPGGQSGSGRHRLSDHCGPHSINLKSANRHLSRYVPTVQTYIHLHRPALFNTAVRASWQ